VKKNLELTRSPCCFLVYGENFPSVSEAVVKIGKMIKSDYETISVNPFDTKLIIIEIRNPNKTVSIKKLNALRENFEGDENNIIFLRQTESGFILYLLMNKSQRQGKAGEAIRKALLGVDIISTRKPTKSETIEDPHYLKIMVTSEELSIEEKLQIAEDLTTQSVIVAVMP
jgi:hypothetical protein